MRWVKDYEVILSALKDWAKDLAVKETEPLMIYMPIKRQTRFLSLHLRYKNFKPGALKGWRDRLPIIRRNITWFQKWIEAAKQASSLSEFKEICIRETDGYPPEVMDY